MNRLVPLVFLVIVGQAAIAFLLVQRVVLPRIYGPPLEEVEEVAEEISVSEEPERVYQNLGKFLLNTTDTSGVRNFRFISLEIVLGVSPSKVYGQLEVQNPRLRDSIINIFNSKTVFDLDSPEDREFIKDEIRFAMNEFLTLGEVLEVYFVDFLVQ